MSDGKNIVLIGMPTSGKSTVGVIAAKMLGMDFIDTDIVLQKREGRKLREIIASQGIEAFLDREEQAVLSIDARRKRCVQRCRDEASFGKCDGRVLKDQPGGA